MFYSYLSYEFRLNSRIQGSVQPPTTFRIVIILITYSPIQSLAVSFIFIKRNMNNSRASDLQVISLISNQTSKQEISLI